MTNEHIKSAVALADAVSPYLMKGTRSKERAALDMAIKELRYLFARHGYPSTRLVLQEIETLVP